MKQVVGLLTFVAVILGGSLYGMNLMLHHKTAISDEEIVIGRIGLSPLNHTRYVVNLTTGREIVSGSTFPFDPYWHIEYDGSCECVGYASKGGYRVDSSLATEGMVHLSYGETVRHTVSRDDPRVKDKLEEALATLTEFREKYHHFRP